MERSLGQPTEPTSARVRRRAAAAVALLGALVAADAVGAASEPVAARPDEDVPPTIAAGGSDTGGRRAPADGGGDHDLPGHRTDDRGRHRFGPRVAHGTVTARDGTTITLEVPAPPWVARDEPAEVRARLDDDTRVREVSEGDWSSIPVGDTVVVIGRRDDDGVLHAIHVRVGDAEPARGEGDVGKRPDGARRRGRVAGIVEAVDGERLRIVTSSGETVTVVPSERVRVTLVIERTIGDVGIGDTVTVVGGLDGSGDDAARIVTIGRLPVHTWSTGGTPHRAPQGGGGRWHGPRGHRSGRPHDRQHGPHDRQHGPHDRRHGRPGAVEEGPAGDRDGD